MDAHCPGISLSQAEIIEGGESILAEVINKTDFLGAGEGADFVALPFAYNCLDNEWSMNRYTKPFAKIMARMAAAKVPMECYSEAIHRYSPKMLQAIETAVRNREINWAERWLQPVAWNNNLKVKTLFDCAAVEIDGTSSKSDEAELLAFSKTHALITFCPHLAD